MVIHTMLIGLMATGALCVPTSVGIGTKVASAPVITLSNRSSLSNNTTPGADDVCFCPYADGSCTDETRICYDTDTDDDDDDSAPVFVSFSTSTIKPREDIWPMCICATDAAGKCKDGTEFCVDDSGAAPHQPICLCEADSDGACKEGSKACSDNPPAPVVDLMALRKMMLEAPTDFNHTIFSIFKNSKTDAVSKAQTSGPSAPKPSQLLPRQGVTALVGPAVPLPDGAEDSFDGGFGFAVVGATDGDEPSSDWDVNRAATCYPSGWFLATLRDGILTDDAGRRGYIASNHQLQFDNPPQAGAMYTSGFFTKNGALGLGDNQIFWACNSGAFANLYDAQIADYCTPVFLQMSAYSGACTNE